MIKILLDSSNKDLYVGLLKDDKLIDEITYSAWQRQSEYMVVELEKIMKRNDISFNDVEGVIVGVGPGSYTGVRISLTIAKTLALRGIKIYPISSLALLADFFLPSICVINARSNRSYVGVYHGDKVILKDQIMTNEELINYINSNPDYIVCGEVKHLGLEAKNAQIGAQMARFAPFLKEFENHLILKPEYLKD